MEKINYKGIKPKEIVWVTFFDESHNLKYCETSNIYRDMYFLYEYNTEKKEWEKTNYKSDNPLELRKHLKIDIVSDKTKKPKGKLF